MTDWIIVYGDYTTYTSEDGSHWDAPATNVQVILITDPDHRWEPLYGGAGYYIWVDGGWRMADDAFALHDYLCLPGPRKVLFGRTLSRKEWRTLLHWATTQLGEKTGRWPDERG